MTTPTLDALLTDEVLDAAYEAMKDGLRPLHRLLGRRDDARTTEQVDATVAKARAAMRAVLSAALASASAPHPLDDECPDDCWCRTSQGPPRAPETLYLLTGWRERAACLRRDGKAEASAAMDACADELRAALLRVPRAPETPQTCETCKSLRDWAQRIRKTALEDAKNPCFGTALQNQARVQADYMTLFLERLGPAPPPPSESRT